MFRTKYVEKTLSTTVREIRHDLLLNFSEESLFEDRTETCSEVYIELPYPVHKPLKKSSRDTVKEFIENKKAYNKLLDNKRRRFRTEKKNIVKEKWNGKKIIHMPKHFWDFCNIKDPHPYVNSDYNYYYTGGVLEYIECDNNQYLIRPDADNYLQAYKLVDQKNIRLKFSLPSTIYGLHSARTSADVSLLLREKHDLNITRLNLVENGIIESKWAQKYENPIFDAKFVESNPSHIGVITSDSKFTVTDIVANKNVYNFESNVAKLLQFHSIEEQKFVVIDGFNIKLIDTRTKKVKNFELGLLGCNPVCTFKVFENSLLLASRHYIMKCDLRYLKDVSHYSHSLAYPPTYLDYVEKSNETYLCVASQDPESKVLFMGSSAFSLPYKVPGILTTIRKCCIENPKLTLLDFLDTSLSFSTTGIKCIDVNKETVIYSTNCLGEILKQRVSKNKIPQQQPLKYLMKWLNQTEISVPALQLTDKRDITDIWLAVTNDVVKKDSNENTEPSRLDEFLNTFGQKYSKRNIKGVLASDFLNVWDEEEDDEEVNDIKKEVNSLPEVPVYDKVTNWMQMNDKDEHSFSSLSFSMGSQ